MSETNTNTNVKKGKSLEFLEIDQVRDSTPIFMIDNSGSTACGFLNKLSVLTYEIEFMKQYILFNEISNFYLMLWDTNFTLPFGDNMLTLESLNDYKAHSRGATYLEAGLNGLPEKWLTGRDHIDIHIFTDGELNGNEQKTTERLRELINIGCHIHITTVEPNHNDYIQGNCHAGNRIYQILNDQGLMKNVKKFISYNQRYCDEPFISLDNPDRVPGYIPFQGKYFKVEETTLFLKHLETMIPTIPEDKLLKFAHELSLTLFHLTSGKPLSIQRNILNLFAELFVDTKIYKNVREIFLQEVDNHEKGKSTTYQAYRRNRNKIFEQAQLSLYDNVKENLTSIETNMFLTFPMMGKNGKKVVVTGSDKEVTHSICLGSKKYDMSAFELGKYHLPVFPSKIVMDDGHKDQCLRQWIRTNYSMLYQLNSASDTILYTFLTDALQVWLSDNVSQEVKNGYQYLARVMLDRKRFGTNVKEYDYLLESNPPAPVKGSIDGINYLLWKSLEHSGVKKRFVPYNEEQKKEYLKSHPDASGNDLGKWEFVVSPFTLWYGIVKMFGDQNLEKTQLRVCQKDLDADGLTEDKVMEFLAERLPNVELCEMPRGLEEVEYTCCITFEPTSVSGGYMIKPHQITRNIQCSPKYVISPKGREQIGNGFNCPICFSELGLDDFVECHNQEKRLEEHLKLMEADVSMPVFDDSIFVYDSTNHEVVDIPEAYYKLDGVEPLIPLDECDFKTGSFNINLPNLSDALSSNGIKITSQEDFNQNVWKRYPFLEKLNMQNACLAGGFCRSILLKQKLKDLDFFIYGNPEESFETFRRLLSDIMKNIKEYQENKNKQNAEKNNEENSEEGNSEEGNGEEGNGEESVKKNKIKFLMMYKPLYNVFEVVCVNDPTDFFEKEYSLDNFKQYDFKSLHRYDKYTIIDPETGKVYRKRRGWRREEEDTSMKDIENRDFKNYFEDGDITGVRMTHRLQFILARYKGIEDVLENFDMYPCRVAFDGKTTYMTPKSALAYRYMINVVDESKFSDLYHHRLSKYFTYGFTIVMPELNMKVVQRLSEIKMGKVKLKIQRVDGATVLIKHESNIEDQLKSIESLEKKNADKGKALYKSSLFCSLVSLLRYVKINNVHYIFNNEIIIPDENGKMKFRETDVDVKFIDKIESRIDEHDFYGFLRDGLSQERYRLIKGTEDRIREINRLMHSRRTKWEEKKKLSHELEKIMTLKPSLECDSILVELATKISTISSVKKSVLGSSFKISKSSKQSVLLSDSESDSESGDDSEDDSE
jgi:hypothetical protein